VNVSNPNEQVVGFFGAFGKVTKGIFVNQNQLDIIKKRNVCGDCRAFYGGQLDTPPPYQ